MVTHAGQHGKHNRNLTSQLDSNLVLSMTTKTAQHNPLTNPTTKRKEKTKDGITTESN
jgi:hypothetical protein